MRLKSGNGDLRKRATSEANAAAPGLRHHPHPWRRDRSSRLYPTHTSPEAQRSGVENTDTPFPCCVPNFSRTVLRIPKCHSPRNHRSAQPSLSHGPALHLPIYHPHPGRRRRVLGDGGRGAWRRQEGSGTRLGTRRGRTPAAREPWGLRNKKRGGSEPCGQGPCGERGTRRCRGTHSAYPVAQGSRRVSLRMRMGRAMWSALHSTSS